MSERELEGLDGLGEAENDAHLDEQSLHRYHIELASSLLRVHFMLSSASFLSCISSQPLRRYMLNPLSTANARDFE